MTGWCAWGLASQLNVGTATRDLPELETGRLPSSAPASAAEAAEMDEMDEQARSKMGRALLARSRLRLRLLFPLRLRPDALEAPPRRSCCRCCFCRAPRFRPELLVVCFRLFVGEAPPDADAASADPPACFLRDAGVARPPSAFMVAPHTATAATAQGMASQRQGENGEFEVGVTSVGK